MAFTSITRGVYGFHEQTLNDHTLSVVNSTARKLVQTELAVFGGRFGNVLAFEGIAAGAAGLIDIYADRTIKTAQLATAAEFVAVGDAVYLVAGTDTEPAGVTHDPGVDGVNAKIGIVVELDPASTQLYVVFRPFVQFTS